MMIGGKSNLTKKIACISIILLLFIAVFSFLFTSDVKAYEIRTDDDLNGSPGMGNQGLTPRVVVKGGNGYVVSGDTYEEVVQAEQITVETVEETEEAEQVTVEQVEEVAQAEEVIIEMGEEAAQAEEVTVELVEEQVTVELLEEQIQVEQILVDADAQTVQAEVVDVSIEGGPIPTDPDYEEPEEYEPDGEPAISETYDDDDVEVGDLIDEELDEQGAEGIYSDVFMNENVLEDIFNDDQNEEDSYKKDGGNKLFFITADGSKSNNFNNVEEQNEKHVSNDVSWVYIYTIILGLIALIIILFKERYIYKNEEYQKEIINHNKSTPSEVTE